METPEETRLRAYLLFQVNNPEQIAADIYEAHGTQGGRDYVVVRADVVDNATYNLVVPVDVADEDWYSDVVGWLQDLADGATPVELKVTGYQPTYPHNAHGYVTDAEFKAGDHDDMGPGRIPNSPGANAWG